jgi:hypothetical protein
MSVYRNSMRDVAVGKVKLRRSYGFHDEMHRYCQAVAQEKK